MLFQIFGNKERTFEIAQFGNFWIFQSFRFYVKSILVILKCQKLLFTILEPQKPRFWWMLNFQKCHFFHFRSSVFCWFGKCQPSKSAKIHKNQNSKPANVLRWQILNLYNPKNWFHVKSKWLKNPDIFTP